MFQILHIGAARFFFFRAHLTYSSTYIGTLGIKRYLLYTKIQDRAHVMNLLAMECLYPTVRYSGRWREVTNTRLKPNLNTISREQ